MAPKPDAYETPAQKRIDAILMAAALAVLAVVVLAVAHPGRHQSVNSERSITKSEATGTN